MSEWINLGNGLQYRKHKTRKQGVRFDRYFRGRYTIDGKTTTFGLGWESQGRPQNRCLADLILYKDNAKKGIQPRTPKEERQIEEEKQKAEQVQIERESRESITFGRYFKESYYPIAKISKKPRSYEQEDAHFRNWLEPVIGDIPFRDIRPFHLESLKSKMLKAGPIERGRKEKVDRVSKVKKQKGKKGRSPRMIQYVFATFRQVWNQGRKDGLVNEDSPSKQIKLPRIDNKRTRFLTYEEADLLLEDLCTRSQQLHDISLLSLHTGMRADEIFSLIWSTVDVDQGLINIFDAKGGDRLAYMTDEVKAMFESFPRGRPNELVFKDRKGGKIKEVSNAFDRAVKDLGFNEGITDRRQKLVFHSLRHTFPSWLVSEGEDLYKVQKLMGHASLAMVQRYAHLAPDSLKSSMKRFEQTLKRKKKQKVVQLKKRS